MRSKYKFNAGSRKNLILIKPEKCKINEQKLFLKLGLLNIRSLTPKAVIVNEMITDNSFDVLCLTETWLKPNDYIGLNESTPPSYCYKHEPRQTGHGGGVATIYSDILNVTQKTGYRFNSFEILLLNVTLSDMQKKSLALATVYRPPGSVRTIPWTLGEPIFYGVLLGVLALARWPQKAIPPNGYHFCPQDLIGTTCIKNVL